MGLFRKKFYSSVTSVASFLSDLIEESGMQCGYRWMYQRCLLSGFRIQRSMIAAIASFLDPRGIELRKKKRLRRRQYFAKGPNYLWHVDSYDKLKNYGLCINGCIDRYSRKIVWCEITCSSNDPRIIAGHYVKAIEKLEACPRRIRGDRGTENKFIAEMQMVLSDRTTFIYGPSVGNQRIESFWRHLRVECCHFWIELFGHLKDIGEFEGDIIDKNLIQFLFMELVQV